ncbi:membrane protein YqaA with SNARE-associated domain [Aquabacterium commune]|uniref:Membrane protein YqaA with SNARE-associated domain n=2 Tax=Aquabacterium commune TaxID=70586 RepID=A0A4R6R6Z7_9BURK|nr:membrane protein YqaA with SNARE-associated domain [Aquabacterium commune]
MTILYDQNGFMEPWMTDLMHAALAWLAIPQVGLGAVFAIAFVSATLLPMGSEPAVFGLVKLQPEMFWPAVLVASLGNTLGGAVTWWMGEGARRAADRLRHRHEAPPPAPHSRADQRAMQWLARFGPKACLLSWLPVVGDPLCAVAGWLRLPFWPCVAYMAVGKFARYLTMTGFLLWVV